ncbi:MAG: DUF3822 family protein [Cytophagales bacterium]|nr:DUF3822 family protein [Cytophagales bacterium]
MAGILLEETPNYKTILSIKDKHLNMNKLHQYHLAISLDHTNLQLCCIDEVTHQCLLLEEYKLKCEVENELISAIEPLYNKHALLTVGFWSAVTLCIKNQKYTLFPTSFFQEDNVADYLKLACPVDTAVEVVKYFTHPSLNMTVAFAVNQLLLDWFPQTYSRTNFKVIHQGSSFIEGIWVYMRERKLKRFPAVFVLTEPHHMHITVMQKDRLLYYNRFMYQNSDEFLNYILIVMQALKLDPNFHEVIFWGNMTKSSLAYRKAYNYIRKVALGKRPAHLQFRYNFYKTAPPTYFDILNAHLCQKKL